MLKAGEAADPRGYGTAEVVVREDQPFQRAAPQGWHCPAQTVAIEVQVFQTAGKRQLIGYASGQIVIVQVQQIQTEKAQLGRHGSTELVVARIGMGEVGGITQLFRQGTSQLVVAEIHKPKTGGVAQFRGYLSDGRTLTGPPQAGDIAQVVIDENQRGNAPGVFVRVAPMPLATAGTASSRRPLLTLRLGPPVAW